MLSAATVEEVFRDVGLFVRTSYLYGSGVPAMIEAESVLKRAQLGSIAERLATLGRAIYQDNQCIQTVTSMSDGEVQVLDQYIREHVKKAIDAKGDSAADILAELAERMIEDCTPPQYVLRNEVAVDGAVAADSDNEGNGTLGSIVLSQYIPAQRFTVECIDASTEGSEQWSVTGSVSGSLDSATTGVAYVDANIYLQFLITAGGTAFEVGDKFYFYTTCTERRYQTFFRDKFGVVMASAASGSQTIEEAWSR